MAIITLNGVNINGSLLLKSIFEQADFTVSQEQVIQYGIAGDLFGYSLDVDGDTLVVGCYSKDTTSSGNAYTNFGGVLVYEYNGTEWIFVKSLGLSTEQISIAGSNPQLGYSVSIKGDWIAVSANQYNLYGAVFLYQKNTIWPDVPTQIINPIQVGNNFGFSLDMNDNFLVIGHRDSAIGSFSNQGNAEVYILDNNIWQHQHSIKLLESQRVSGQRLGWSVSIDNNMIAVGGPGNTTGTGSGMVMVSTYSNGSWSDAISFFPNTTDGFGSSVKVRNNKIYVGAPLGINNETGRIYIYEYSGSWQISETLTVGISGNPTILDVSSSNINSRVGWNIDVNAQDDILIAGSFGYSNSTYTNVGAVYVFEKVNGVWGSSAININGVSRLDPNPSSTNLRFGNTVCFRNNEILVGAPNSSSIVGSVYWFK